MMAGKISGNTINASPKPPRRNDRVRAAPTEPSALRAGVPRASDTSNGTYPAAGKLNSSASARCQSPDFNKIYYNPSFTYTPPVDATGSALARSPANTFNHA